MKINKLYIGLGMLAASVSMVSCKSDYLEIPPESSISETQIGESIEAARAALYGLCQAMYIGQYMDNGDRFNCGEPWFQTYYGDAGSPDFYDSFIWGFQYEFQNWYMMNRQNGFGVYNAWMYGYNLISQANKILAVIDNVPGNEEAKNFVKAQTLTMRAHGYIRLMQVYGPRYEDRGTNGDVLCLILRKEPGTNPMPLSTYAECIDFIYNDLDEAISLYQSAPSQRRTIGYEPDINVAQGLYSRIALLNHDWAKASAMAAAARTPYPIMSPADYKKGFADPTSEWIWYNDMDPTWIGYNAWGSSYSCNGYYATAYNFSGAGCISIYLYDQIYNRHNDDVRCELFWTPDKANKYYDFGFKREDFWNPEYVHTADDLLYMFGPNMNDKMSAAICLFVKNMNPDPSQFTEQAFGADTSIDESILSSNLQIRKWFNGLSNYQNTCYPGAQLKFWSYPSQFYGSHHAFLRSSELLLTQAEAEIEMGNEGKARELLVELNKQRIPSGYTCDLSGDALKEEVRLYRRMELWGEGDCWFSFKRWNTTVERVAWVANDPTTDFFLPAYEGTFGPDWGNSNYRQGGGWRYRIPTAETNYNPIVAEQLNQ